MGTNHNAPPNANAKDLAMVLGTISELLTNEPHISDVFKKATTEALNKDAKDAQPRTKEGKGD